jgi:hypothetical protein
MRPQVALAVAFSLPLLGCPATSSHITTPSGGDGYSVDCGAAVPGQCFEEAGEQCPSGYRIIREFDAGLRHKMIVECR